MAELVMQEVESLTKMLQALSATRMQAQYKLKQAHHNEDPLGSLCLQLHHEASLAESNFKTAVWMVELIGWKAKLDRDGRFTKLAPAETADWSDVCEVWDYFDIRKRKAVGILRRFQNSKKCREWLMDGIKSCEGSERDHYVNMLKCLDAGDRKLYYR